MRGSFAETICSIRWSRNRSRNNFDTASTPSIRARYQSGRHIYFSSSKSNSRFSPQLFASVTVLFLDISNVGLISAANPLDAVSCMNIAFTSLDHVIDRHNVYKVVWSTNESPCYIKCPIGVGGDCRPSLHGRRRRSRGKQNSRQRRGIRYITKQSSAFHTVLRALFLSSGAWFSRRGQGKTD